jgi:hypothetical protein
MSSRAINPGPLIPICVALLLALLLGVTLANPASFQTLLWGASLGVLVIQC